MDFTQKLKQKWITALKSGEYKQIQHGYKECGYGDNFKMKGHCCVAVLGDITGGSYPSKVILDFAPLIKANDRGALPENRDYSNVLPLIEKLKTTD